MTSAMPSWLFWAMASAAFAALTAIFAKLGVERIDSDVATFVRTGIILVMLAGLLFARGEVAAIAAVPWRGWLFLLLSGLATGVSWLCYFRALQLGPASRVAPIDKLSVVLVALFAALFLGERLSPTGWSGVALIAVGAMLVAWGA